MDGPININLDDNARRHLLTLIRQQLGQLTGSGAVDDVLPEYVMVMVANQKSKSQVVVDLEAFLGPSSAAFTNWLWDTLQSLHQGVIPPILVPQSSMVKQPEVRSTSISPISSPSSSSPSSAPPKQSVFASVISVPPRAERPRNSDHPAPSRLILNAVNDAVHSVSTNSNTVPTKDKDVTMSDQVERERPSHRRRPGRDYRDRDNREHRDRGPYRDRERERERDRGDRDRDYNHNMNMGGRKSDENTVTFTVTLNGVADEPALVPAPAPARAGSKRRTVESLSSSSGSSTSSVPLGALPAPSENGDEEMVDVDGTKKSKKQKCQFWPNCKRGDACLFIHPSVQCTSFPNCPYGTECIFIHPSIPCKFGVKCTRPECAFNHPTGRGPIAKQGVPCKYGYACPRGPCTFVHPPEACRYGEACSRPDCAFAHGKACRFGATCATPGCTFLHQSAAQPSVQAPPIPVPCKFGNKCTNPNCRFQHDSKADADMAEADTSASVAALSASLPATPPREQATA